jgi:hypothetical protein
MPRSECSDSEDCVEHDCESDGLYVPLFFGMPLLSSVVGHCRIAPEHSAKQPRVEDSEIPQTPRNVIPTPSLQNQARGTSCIRFL